MLGDMGIRTNTATASIGPLGTLLGSLASPMTLVAAGASAVGAGLAAAVTTASGFEASMSRVASVSGASSQELALMTNAAREAGATTVFSASQAADAMYFLASSGMTAEQQMTALPQTLNLASAGGLDLAKAAEITTNTLAQFGLKAEETGRVSNVLAAGAAKSNTDIMQLGNGMNYVGPVAASLGYSLESTTAALGMLANAGLKGEQGGTTLRGALSALLSPSKAAGEALGEMGLNIEDVNPAMNSMSDIVAKLEAGHMTAAQAVKIFGRESGPGMLAMVSQGSGALKKLETDITGTNKASEMSAQMTNNMKGAWAEFTSSTEEAAIALGNVLLPVVTGTIQAATAGVGAITGFGKALSSWSGIGQEGGMSNRLSEMTGGLIGISTEKQKMVAEAQAKEIGEIKAYEENKAYVEKLQTETSEVDPNVLTNMESQGKKAGEVAGEAAGKSFADAQESYIKSHSSGGFSDETMARMASQASDTADAAARTVGKTTIGGFDFTLNDQNRLILPDGSQEYFTSSKDLSARLVPYIEDYIGRAMTDVEKAEIKNDIKAQVQLSTTVEIENKWDISNSQRSWMKFAEENKDLAKRAGEEIVLVLYNAEQEAMKSNDPTLKESLANVMKGLAEPGSVPAQIFNQSLADCIDAGMIGSKWGDALTQAATAAASKVKNMVGGMKIELPSLQEIMEDPGLINKNFKDILAYQTNYFIPEMKKNVSEARTLLEQGVDPAMITKNYIDPIRAVTDYLPAWLQLLNSDLEKGKIDLERYISVFDKMTGDTEKGTRKATEGYDNLKSAMEGCAECAMSEFGMWQEAQTDLFQGAYIGPTSGYQGWKDAQQQLAQTGSSKPSIQAQVQVDKSASDAYLAEIAAQKSTLKVMTSLDRSAYDKIIAEIAAPHTMQVMVSVSANASEITAMVESAVYQAVAAVQL